jgi:hypothetical protein
MAKPQLINVVKVGDTITQGDCPICRVTFSHSSFLGEITKNQIPDMYVKHLEEKHSDVLKEDASQAASRIVREATKD